MTTTRIYGNNPFEVYLKPTNKIEIVVSSGAVFSTGEVVAFDSSGGLIKANASNRATSSVLGIVSVVSGTTVTVVTQGVVEVPLKGYNPPLSLIHI